MTLSGSGAAPEFESPRAELFAVGSQPAVGRQPPANFGAAVRGTPQHGLSFQQDGPNHLGLWYNTLPEHQMASCGLRVRRPWPGDTYLR